jgi:hypothetical protein
MNRHSKAGEPFSVNLPKVLAGVIDNLAGDVVELRLSDPNLRIDFPAASVSNLEQYARTKSKAPVGQPSSLVGVSLNRKDHKRRAPKPSPARDLTKMMPCSAVRARNSGRIIGMEVIKTRFPE